MNLTACWRLFMRTWHRAVPGVVFSLLSSVCLAGPGDLDVTLAGTGKMRVAAGGGIDAGYAVVRQTDGKLIVAGESGNFGVTVPSLVRYNTNGTPDLTFGNGGKVMLESAFGGARAVVIAPTTGKILVAGYATLSATDSSFLLARLNADGTLDTTFNSNGFLFTAMSSGQDIAHALAVQTDGRIVLAGEAGGSIALARYDANGTLDATLDSDGKLISAFAGTGRALLLMSGTNSKMVVAGQQFSSGQRFAVVLRFNFNGSLDTSFNNTGFAQRTDLVEANGLAMLAILAGEEKLIITGGKPSGVSGGPVPAPSIPDFGLWSLDAATGAVDTTFGTNGALIQSVQSPGLAVRVQTSGSAPSRLLVLTKNSEVRRFTLTGAVDFAFGGGTGKVDALPGIAQAFLLQPDGRIVTAGTAEEDLAIVRLTSAGAMDSTFSGDGFRRDDVGHLVSAARATVVQPDGKLLVAGDRAVIRLLPDGSLDPTFDEDGRVALKCSIPSMALQGDGKILMIGNLESDGFNETTLRTAYLLRLNADGSTDLDDTMSEPIAGPAAALLVQPDGRILVAGVHNLSALGAPIPFLAVYRFLPDGRLDQTFSGDGMAVVAASGVIGESGDAVSARALALQADGRIVVTGRLAGPENQDFGVARLLPDGALDSSFSGDGITVFSMGAGDDLPAALGLQGGKIVVAGRVEAAADDVGLARLLTDGTLDSTFGTSGKSIISLSPGDDHAGALLVLPDGRLCLAGTVTNGGATEFVLARFLPNGTLDNTFGTGGKVAIDITPGSAESGLALAIDPVRRLVIAGAGSNLLGVARVLGDPFGSITGLSRDSVSGVVALEGFATPGYTHQLQTSTILSGFTSTGPVAPGASGFWQTTRTSPDARRFYKLTTP